MEEYKQRYLQWLESDKVDEDTKAELRSISDNEDEIKFRFSSYMEFGTGGLRSKMGAGCAMMNIYTVAQSTEGVARAIESLGEDAKNRGVILGYDSRNNSALHIPLLICSLHANLQNEIGTGKYPFLLL